MTEPHDVSSTGATPTPATPRRRYEPPAILAERTYERDALQQFNKTTRRPPARCRTLGGS